MYSNELVCNILEYIDKNINNKITIEDLANIFFYNRFYIMKLFKKELKLSIVDYINKMRIFNSVMYLKKSNNSFTNIALNNGFTSLEYFSEIVKQIIGYSPRTIKYYFTEPFNLDEDIINNINKSINNLYELVKFKKEYLKKRRPKEHMVKKLSIFK